MSHLLVPEWGAPKNIHAFTTLKTYPIDHLSTLLPSPPIWLKQVHSNIAVEAVPTDAPEKADAVYTTEINRPCIVQSADCLPLLLCNHDGTKVAAIHAGWRGLSAGIIENTFHAINGVDDEWHVWLGPAIGPNRFEVGRDVYEAFTKHDPEAITAFQAQNKEKWLANLYLLAKQRLIKLGIKKVYGGTYCTYEQSDLFYSYRRDKTLTGKLVSLIWRT